MDVDCGSACCRFCTNICVDLARGRGITGVELNDGFGAEQACCCPDGGKRVLLPDGTVDLGLPLDGTVAGGVAFLIPPRCLGNNCVETDLCKADVRFETLNYTRKSRRE